MDRQREDEFAAALERLVPTEVVTRQDAAQRTRTALLREHRRMRAGGRSHRMRNSELVKSLATSGALLVLAFLLVFGVLWLTTGGVTRVTIHEGSVSHETADAKTRVRESGNLGLMEEDRLRTSEGALVTVHIHGENHVRLDDSTELHVDDLESDSAVLVQEEGNSYHNVDDEFTLIVEREGVVARGTGSTFNVDFHKGRVRVRVIDGTVTVIAKNGLSREVDEGNEALVDPKDDSGYIALADTEPSDLDNEWYRWNAARDSID